MNSGIYVAVPHCSREAHTEYGHNGRVNNSEYVLIGRHMLRAIPRDIFRLRNNVGMRKRARSTAL